MDSCRAIRYIGGSILGQLSSSASLFRKAIQVIVRQLTFHMGHKSLRISRTILTGILSSGKHACPIPGLHSGRPGESLKHNQRFLPLPRCPSSPTTSITAGQRVNWILTNTIDPAELTIGVFSAGIETAQNSPKEYGGSWSGFGKRYGIRLSTVATSNVMEAGLGSMWGEDPRYFPSYAQTFKGRVKNVVVSTFLTHNRNGEFSPAYARYLAIPGSNFLSNTWRADSEATTSDALERTVWGFLGQMGSNAFSEFWPDFHRRVLHGKF